jgi:hypothetical protein
MQTSRHEAVNTVVQTINRVWLNGHVEALAPMVDPNIVVVFPDFSGRSHGREQFLAGFRDFCENAKVHEFHDHGVTISRSQRQRRARRGFSWPPGLDRMVRWVLPSVI